MRVARDSIRSPPSRAPVEAEQPLLHHVLRLAHAAEHPVGDGERRPAEVRSSVQ
jgi:hypothetical protein